MPPKRPPYWVGVLGELRADAVGRLNVEPQQAARLIVVIERIYQDEKRLRTAVAPALACGVASRNASDANSVSLQQQIDEQIRCEPARECHVQALGRCDPALNLWRSEEISYLRCTVGRVHGEQRCFSKR